MKTQYNADEVRRLCRTYHDNLHLPIREELIEISRGRLSGTVVIYGEDGADRDDAISALTMTIGGPW